MPRKTLKSVSLLFSLLIFTWPILMVLSQPQGDVSTQIFQLSSQFWPHALNFGLALLIAPLLLVMLAFLVKSLDEAINPISLWLATLFYLLYFVLVSISYGSQILFKWLFMTAHTPMSTLLNWYFYQEPSLVVFINQTGYLAFSIATLILFIPLFSVKSTLLKSINVLFVVSALLQTTASLSLYFQVPFLGRLTLVSGMLMLPVGILIHLYSRNLIKTEKEVSQ